MALKMIVTDLDGTLLTSADVLAPSSVAAFAAIRKRGIVPVVATGRMYREALFAAKAIGADECFMGMNGAQTMDLRSNSVIYSHFMEPEAAREAVRVLEEQDVFYQVYTHDSVYARQHWIDAIADVGLKEAYVRKFAASIAPFGALDALRVVKVFAVCSDGEKQTRLLQALQAVPSVTVVSSYKNYFEILPPGLNKGAALLRLCSHLGVSPDEVAAIGDSDNDIEMLTQAGVGIAMGNAFARLKGLADHIVPSNDEDGVAYALNAVIPQYL